MCKKNKDKQKVGFFGEFKAFITRGNVIDLAVGVIIGGAFTAIVTALSDKILRPLINGIISWVATACGFKGDPLAAMYTILVPGYSDAEKTVLDLSKSIYIDWGAFISAIINFLLVAFILFLIVKGINKVHQASEEAKKLVASKLKKEETEAAPEEVKAEEK